MRSAGGVGRGKTMVDEPTADRQHDGMAKQRADAADPVQRVHRIGATCVAIGASADQHHTAHVVGMCQRIDEGEPAAPRVPDQHRRRAAELQNARCNSLACSGGVVPAAEGQPL